MLGDGTDFAVQQVFSECHGKQGGFLRGLKRFLCAAEELPVSEEQGFFLVIGFLLDFKENLVPRELIDFFYVAPSEVLEF